MIDITPEVRFLESVENLKRVVYSATGRLPNTELGLQISACLQQGRPFFEAAATGAREIRPLLLSYGTIAFAKAAIAARTFTKLETLPHSHGLRDISAGNARMNDLRVKVESDGVYHHSVDTSALVERVSVFDSTKTVWISTPSCSATDIAGLELSLDDVLSRIGVLSKLYRQTFDRESKSLPLSMTQSTQHRELYEFRVDVRADSMPSAADFIAVLSDLRRRFPFLDKLNFTRATFAWDHIVILFDNAQPGGLLPEVDLDLQRPFGEGADLLPARVSGRVPVPPIRLAEILPCSQGGLTQELATFSSPVLPNTYLSEFTLLYLGTYLLGSLVRYRPQIWVHALYGTEMPCRPRDDASRALIESFLNHVSSTVPQLCAATIRAGALS